MASVGITCSAYRSSSSAATNLPAEENYLANNNSEPSCTQPSGHHMLSLSAHPTYVGYPSSWLAGFPAELPTQSPHHNAYGAYLAIHQQHASNSQTDPLYISPQIAANTKNEESIQQTVSKPERDPDTATRPPATLRFSKLCKWEGCKYADPFSRAADLLRHVKTVHISPGSYTCSEPRCGKSCSRKDNLAAHRQRIHGRWGSGKWSRCLIFFLSLVSFPSIFKWE